MKWDLLQVVKPKYWINIHYYNCLVTFYFQKQQGCGQIPINLLPKFDAFSEIQNHCDSSKENVQHTVKEKVHVLAEWNEAIHHEYGILYPQ